MEVSGPDTRRQQGLCDHFTLQDDGNDHAVLYLFGAWRGASCGSLPPPLLDGGGAPLLPPDPHPPRRVALSSRRADREPRRGNEPPTPTQLGWAQGGAQLHGRRHGRLLGRCRGGLAGRGGSGGRICLGGLLERARAAASRAAHLRDCPIVDIRRLRPLRRGRERGCGGGERRGTGMGSKLRVLIGGTTSPAAVAAAPAVAFLTSCAGSRPVPVLAGRSYVAGLLTRTPLSPPPQALSCGAS